MKSGLFILLESQKYMQMTKLERSIDLDTYLRKFSDRKKSWDDNGSTFCVKLAFGERLEDDEAVDVSYFMDNPLGSNILTLSQLTANEPCEMQDKKKDSPASKDNAEILNSFLNKCYHEESSSLQYGFFEEMKNTLYSLTIVKDERMRKVREFEKKNPLPFFVPISMAECLFDE